MIDGITPTPTQTAALKWRNHVSICNIGGRGGGKSVTLLLDALSYLATVPGAKILILREQHAGSAELQSELLSMCLIAFGPGVRRNKAAGTIECPNGSIAQFSNVSDLDSYAKLQGRSFHALYPDEIGNYAPQAFDFVQRIRSNLRGPPGHRPHIHMCANPGGRSHSRLLKLHARHPPWTVYEDDYGEKWINVHSTYKDNPHIDQASYERSLLASCGNDENMVAAWLRGDWTMLGGSLFAPPYDPSIHIIPAPFTLDCVWTIGGDWGTGSPSTATLLGRLRNDHGRMKRHSIIAFDECCTCIPHDLTAGDGSPPLVFAEQIKAMAKRNDLNHTPSVVIDDMRGLAGDTVVSLFNQAGLSARKPYKKSRVGNWNLIRQMLHNAKTGDGPGLFFVEGRVPHLIETFPECPRSTSNPEDSDHRWAYDHHLDSVAYGVFSLQITNGARWMRIPYL